MTPTPEERAASIFENVIVAWLATGNSTKADFILPLADAILESVTEARKAAFQEWCDYMTHYRCMVDAPNTNGGTIGCTCGLDKLRKDFN